MPALSKSMRRREPSGVAFEQRKSLIVVHDDVMLLFRGEEPAR
jgi:hypothetical protein